MVTTSFFFEQEVCNFVDCFVLFFFAPSLLVHHRFFDSNRYYCFCKHSLFFHSMTNFKVFHKEKEKVWAGSHLYFLLVLQNSHRFLSLLIYKLLLKTNLIALNMFFQNLFIVSLLFFECFFMNSLF
jgi:hypothetical protein